MSEFTTKVFNGFVSQGKLMGTRCKSCGEIQIPPRKILFKVQFPATRVV